MPHRSSTGRLIKYYPHNASVNIYSEEVTPGCMLARVAEKKLYLRLANKRKRLIWVEETQTLDRGRLKKESVIWYSNIHNG